MKPIYLQTRRLILRQFQESDTEAVFEYAANERVMRYIQPPFTYKESEEFVRRFGCSEPPLVYALCRRPDSEGGDSSPVIGHVIFHPFERKDIYELGFILDEKHQHQGYALEIGRALLTYGFRQLGLHKMVAEAAEGNLASHAVLKKLGLRQEGVLRKQLLHRGEWLDEYRFGILSAEFSLLYQHSETD